MGKKYSITNYNVVVIRVSVIIIIFHGNLITKPVALTADDKRDLRRTGAKEILARVVKKKFLGKRTNSNCKRNEYL